MQLSFARQRFFARFIFFVDLLKWLIVKSRHFGAAIAVPILVGALWAFLVRGEPLVRLSGMSLQLIGFWTLLYGIHRTLQDFGYPNLAGTLWIWIRKEFTARPRFARSVVIEARGISLGVGTAISVGTVVIPRIDADLAARINILEQHHAALQSELGEARRELIRETEVLKRLVNAEADERKRSDGDLDKRLTAKFVDGAALDILGIWFFAFGVVAGTASVEIAKLLPNCLAKFA